MCVYVFLTVFVCVFLCVCVFEIYIYIYRAWLGGGGGGQGYRREAFSSSSDRETVGGSTGEEDRLGEGTDGSRGAYRRILAFLRRL